MATVRHAVVEFNRSVGPQGQWLGLRMAEGEPLGHCGGQYLIVHTGIQSAAGKPIKRTYSVVSSDAEQDRFELAVKPLEGGVGSQRVGSLQAGDVLAFSGPWGKKTLPDPSVDAEPLLIATDTGITTAMGLVRGQQWAPLRSRTRILWLRHPEDGFVDLDWVRERLDGCGRFQIQPIAAVGEDRRVGQAVACLEGWLNGDAFSPPAATPPYVLLSGDGLVVRALRDALVSRGVEPERVATEHFFNKPPKA